jgi:flagellar motor switch/type III secretory pathway protein FliN
LSDGEKFIRDLNLRLNLGQTFLDAESMVYLEPEDIVLIEQPRIKFENGNFAGNSELLVGGGANFRLRGAVDNFDAAGSLIFRLEEVSSEEARRKFTPAKYKMDVEENEPAEKNNFENESAAAEGIEDGFSGEQLSPALENVQVALRVEIAGNKISLRELQNLRAGQIIALGVSPTDPVRLVTDGSDEPVATGELIEIEGQLGVRLTKVFI